MEKKEYTKPAMRLYKIRHHEHLLQSSLDPSRGIQIYDDEMENEDDVM